MEADADAQIHAESLVRPSEFLDDLPAEHLHEDNPRPRRPSYIERAEPWPSRAREAFDYADPAPDWENESQDREMARARQRVLGEDGVPPVAGGGWSRGMRTFHPQFGEGVVLDVVGQGPSAKVLVRFWDHRERKLVARVLSEP